MCGGSELLKSGDFFVCESCGTKYSNEEAKKLLIDTQVDVSGSVIKIDTSNELANLFVLARRSVETSDYENGEKYFTQILKSEPKNWEALFFQAFCKSMACKIREIEMVGDLFTKSLVATFQLIKNEVKTKEGKIEAVKTVAVRSNELASMLYNSALNYYLEMDHDIRPSFLQDTVGRCNKAILIESTVGKAIEIYFPDYSELHEILCLSLKTAVARLIDLNEKGILTDSVSNLIQSLTTQIKKYDSSYKSSFTPRPNISAPTGGCYIATAVYGSYDCPEVWLLRRFRDYNLNSTWLGKAFIKVYYRFSPSLVKRYGKIGWLSKFSKALLDIFIKWLLDRGVSNTPYFGN